MDMEQFRLTGEDIMEAEIAWEAHEGKTPLGLPGWIADAATEKALRCVLLWLQQFEDQRRDAGGNIIAIIHGRGLEMAANELEAMLAAIWSVWYGGG